MPRRLLLLFAALLALLAGAPATALAAAPADPAPGAQNCARAFPSAAQHHAPAITGESACTRPGSVTPGARTAGSSSGWRSGRNSSLKRR